MFLPSLLLPILPYLYKKESVFLPIFNPLWSGHVILQLGIPAAMTSLIDFHIPAVVGAPSSPLQQPLTDTGEVELQNHLTGVD